MSLKEAIDAIAARAAERRTRPATYQEKVALEASNVLGAVGDYIKNNDTAKGALLGAGAGALGGVGTGLMGPGSWKEKRRRAMSNVLGGGLAGAAIGGGLGAAKQYGGGLKPGGGPSGTAGTPGTFTDPDTGKQMQIDPKVLKAHPELAERVQKLSTPSVETRISQGIGGAVAGAGYYAPFTTAAAAGVGANELRNIATAGRFYGMDNLKAALREKDISSMLGDKSKAGLIAKMPESEKAKLLADAKGGRWSGLKSLFGRGPNPDDVLHTGLVKTKPPKVPKGSPPAPPGAKTVNISRADVNDMLRSGRNANRILGGKIPAVVGRNTAIIGAGVAADAARHYYLGEQADEQQRKELRELMSQVARETAAGKHR